MSRSFFQSVHSPRQVIAWGLYDFADTAFSALFITLAFPIIIKQHLGGTELQIGLAMGLSLLVAALIVPFIGALSDAIGKRIPLLVVSTVITVIFTAATGYVSLVAALIFGFLANLLNTIDIDLYDSFIPDLAPKEAQGRLSGFGAALGYLGTLLALALAYGALAYFGFESRQGLQILFPLTAIFFLIFSLPMFIVVRDKPHSTLSVPNGLKKAWQELRSTFSTIRSIKGLGAFLLASFIYNDVLHTAIIFLSLLGTEKLGLSLHQFLGIFALTAVTALGGALFFGKISDKLRPRKTLLLMLLFWVLVLVLLAAGNDIRLFLFTSSLGGALLGGIWVCNRHMVSLLSPPNKIAQIFGFEGLTEKVAGVIGPIGFGFLAVTYGYSAGILFLLGFLLVGLIILVRFVPKHL